MTNIQDSVASDFVKNLKQQCKDLITNIQMTSKDNEYAFACYLNKNISMDKVNLYANRIEKLIKKYWTNDVYQIKRQGYNVKEIVEALDRCIRENKPYIIEILMINQVYLISKKEIEKVINKKETEIKRQIERNKRNIEDAIREYFTKTLPSYGITDKNYSGSIEFENHDSYFTDKIDYNWTYGMPSAEIKFAYNILYINIKNGKPAKLLSREMDALTNIIRSKIKLSDYDKVETIKVDGFDGTLSTTIQIGSIDILIYIDLHLYRPKNFEKNSIVKLVDSNHILNLIHQQKE